jgi:branched-chain amino acid transport system permease protein
MNLPSAAGRVKSTLPWLLLIALAVWPSTNPSPNAVRLLFITAVWTTTSLAWNLVGGLAGQVSFGFAVFYGLGSYAAAVMINSGRSPLFAFAGAAAIAALASFLVGLPTFRLRGPYFAIATIGVGEAVRVVMNNLDSTGGASGYRIMEKGAFRQIEHYYYALGLVALAVVIASIVKNSKFGLALRAIKQDQEAAAAVGVNPYFCKLWVHAIAAALTGVAGAVHARYAAFIYPGSEFAFQTSISILLMPVIGGIGTIWGAVLGGVIFGIVEEEFVVRFPNIHLLLYGALLMLIILFEPDGLVGLMRRTMRLLKRWFWSKREDSGSPDADKVLWGRGSVEGRKL